MNDDDMIQALESGRVARYVTDFPDEKIAVAAHVVALPHLGASTPGERGELRPAWRRTS